MNYNIKSYVLRQGKITKGQIHTLNALSTKYCVDSNNHQEPLFNNLNPTVIEIGSGMGDATFEIAKNNPNINYLAIEVHSPGIATLIKKIYSENINNVKIIKQDAIIVLQNIIQNNSIYGFHIFFPDPWPKKRHNKRRLINNEFCKLLNSKLIGNGYIHIATDWENYAENIKKIFSNNQFTSIDTRNNRPLTKFETKGIQSGHKIWDLFYIKNTKND